MSSTVKKPTLSKNGKRLGRPPKGAPKLTVVKEARLSKTGKRLGRPPKVKPLATPIPVAQPVAVETPSFWKRWFGWLV